MNKYFTKYLPVEGGFRRTVKSTEGIPVDYEYEVKLFLCSRDIQGGDEVFGSDTPDIKFKWSEDAKHGAEIANSLHLYMKVIGEISPDALSYVKEEQEFEEEQVGYVYWDERDSENYHEEYIPLHYKLPKWVENFFISVKGPCGHFH